MLGRLLVLSEQDRSPLAVALLGRLKRPQQCAELPPLTWQVAGSVRLLVRKTRRLELTLVTVTGLQSHSVYCGVQALLSPNRHEPSRFTEVCR